MQDCKPVNLPIPIGRKLIVDQCPKSQEGRKYMACVPYSNVVGSLMYSMVNTRPDIAHAVGILSRYITTPEKEHWEVVEKVFRYLHAMTNLPI